MIVDANLLLYAIDTSSPHHATARSWWESTLNGHRRVGLPWQTIGAFLRLSTHPRVVAQPLHASQASAVVDKWIASPVVWIPTESQRTWAILKDLVTSGSITGNLVPDAQLAAIAIENAVPVASADADFARFDGVLWINPLSSTA